MTGPLRHAIAAAMLEGLPPNNAAHLMRLACDEATARAVADIIVETFDPAETAAAAFEEAGSPADRTPGTWAVEVYFGHVPDETAIRALVAAVAGEPAAAALSFGHVVHRDWVTTSLAGMPPVRAGRFLVHGAHDRIRVCSNDIALEIEAALAFGTGHHGSTLGCLRTLDAILKVRRPTHILDIGTGTGVLALAAARALRRKVAAGDIDSDAIDAARGNARRNGAAPWLTPVVAKGVTHPALRAGAPYDLIFGNILARPLRRLAPALAELAAPGAEIVLSGLLARDVAGILSAYRPHHFSLVRRIDIEGWATLLLRRRLSHRASVAVMRPPH
jgi:ribosomal protein L11 methyltransferase